MTPTDPTLKAVAIVGVIALVIYALYRHKSGQPSLYDVVNRIFAHPEPVHRTPLEQIRDKCVAKPVSDEELRAVVDAHKSGSAAPLGVSLTPYLPPGSAGTPTAGTPASPASGTSAAPPAAGASTPSPADVLAAVLKTPPPK